MNSKYRVRDGVVLESIAGVYLIISTYAVREFCPYVKRINETGAYYFEQIQNGFSAEDILGQVAEAFPYVERSVLESDLYDFIEDLVNNGYLIKES